MNCFDFSVLSIGKWLQPSITCTRLPPGNYSQALADLQECLALQEKHLEPDSRLLAETHYQLGLTHTLHCQYSPAIEHFHNATTVIKTRLGMHGGPWVCC